MRAGCQIHPADPGRGTFWRWCAVPGHGQTLVTSLCRLGTVWPRTVVQMTPDRDLVRMLRQRGSRAPTGV
jgi:hypothetical protein